MASSEFTESEITEALMACVAWAGNAKRAVQTLNSKGKHSPSESTLREWMRDRYAARYNEMREKYSAQLEDQLAHDYREVSGLAVEVQRKALEKAAEMIDSNRERDPARAAANAATVAQKMTDKMLSLTGRPTQITETRNLNEILRSLAAKGVVDLGETKEAPGIAEQAG